MPERAETIARDFIGRAIFRAGKALHNVGLWLCGVAGWWDAGTDQYDGSSDA